MDLKLSHLNDALRLQIPLDHRDVVRRQTILVLLQVFIDSDRHRFLSQIQ